MARVVVLGHRALSLLLFRSDLIRELQSRGHFVVTGASDSDVGARFSQHGIPYRPTKISPTGLNPFTDLYSLFDIKNFFKTQQPDIVLSYGVKPVIYGSLAARMARVPRTAAMITGLGSSLIGSGFFNKLLAGIVKRGYRIALKHAEIVFFQNPENRDLFVAEGIVDRARTKLISGSGVNLSRFTMSPAPAGPPVFLMIARLLRDKGVVEYVEAAKIIKARHRNARFQLLGPFYSNPSSLNKDTVDQWIAEGAIEYLGETEDVRPYLNDSSVYVLPSYMEGTPRSVLEAMATGRAVITTDVPGCRQTVRDGYNGFLVPAKDSIALANAMEKFIMNTELIRIFGINGRAFVEEKFDVRIVNRDIINALGL